MLVGGGGKRVCDFFHKASQTPEFSFAAASTSGGPTDTSW